MSTNDKEGAQASPFALPPQRAIPVHRLTPADLPALMQRLPAAQANWARTVGFDPNPGHFLLLPDIDNSLARVLIGVEAAEPLWQLAGLPGALPPGVYALAEAALPEESTLLLLGWALGALPSDRQAGSAALSSGGGVRLLASQTEQDRVKPLAEAIGRVRRLVNLPANQLGPTQLAAEVCQLAQRHAATYREWVGEALPPAGFPLVHGVGQAAADAPRVAELQWGEPGLPGLVLIGKGVCFDSGGLDLKPASGMRWMKKDMGGAAHAIALAELVMEARLPVHLTLVIPAVENAVGAGALRPGDIVRAGNGRLVEIENTDAEGRLLLADALYHATRGGAKSPELVIDLATLTGAARMALGADLPALFSNQDALADDLLAHARRMADPLWRLPLWAPYRSMLKSQHADTLNAASAPLAGAITAALFLEDFVPDGIPWLHLDLFAWNLEDRPGRPKGGEAQGLRAVFALLAQRFPVD